MKAIRFIWDFLRFFFTDGEPPRKVYLNGEEITGFRVINFTLRGSFTLDSYPDSYFVWDETSQGYTAGSLRISGAIAEGQTLKEAYSNLKDAEQVIEETDPDIKAINDLLHRDHVYNDDKMNPYH